MNDRVFIKGFDNELKCRDYQFEVGKEYKIDLPEGYVLTKDDLCTDKVFHFCDSLQKVHQFYNCGNENNRYCIIEVLGQFCECGDKCGSNHIKIVSEIVGDELKIAKGLTRGNSGIFNSGDRNSGSFNSGDRNSGNHNSGDRNSGSFNSGDYNSGSFNSGSCNSGDRNSGNHNSGDRNSGSFNSGDYNSGSFNSGDRNSGDRNSGSFNSGDRNSGNHNSGLFNKTNNSNGIFCNKEPKICIFNIPTDWTLSEFRKSKYYRAIKSSDFSLTEWVSAPDYTQQKAGPDGKLKTNAYEEACRKWWNGLTEENKAIIKDIPNFNVDVFCDITGIDKSGFAES